MQSKIIGDDEQVGARIVSTHANLILMQRSVLVALGRGLLLREY
jgi:hypothetical protein